MTDLNAEIETSTKRLLEVARAVRGTSLKALVQEIFDAWLDSHGYKRDMLDKLAHDDAKRKPK
jgi:hypothetical protein